jgi:hypothetical protein
VKASNPTRLKIIPLTTNFWLMSIITVFCSTKGCYEVMLAPESSMKWNTSRVYNIPTRVYCIFFLFVWLC